MTRFILLMAVVVCAVPALGKADMYHYQLGDDDGFGTESPLKPGDDLHIDISWDEYALLADGNATDELIPGARDPRDFTFIIDTFASITDASLFLQYIDWPESQAGYLWIDGRKTAFQFPRASYDQVSPWTVLGATIDLMPYADSLRDGRVAFNLLGESTDAYIVDYMRLSIEGSVVPVPIPGAALLGMLGLGYAGIRLRRGAY